MNDELTILERLQHAIIAYEDKLLPPPLGREAEMLIHKMNHPMADILAQVPGDSLSARAAKLKVSRQTMYVWASERFRPTLRQAKVISKVTGVPVASIVDNGFEEGYDARRKARKKAAPVARKRKSASAGDGGRVRKRKVERRVRVASSRGGNARKVRERASV